MSRNVPMDQELSDDDRRYLRQLGAHGMALEQRLDEAYPPDPDALAEFEQEERQRNAGINGVGLTPSDQASLQVENEKLRAELAQLRGLDAPDAGGPDYTGWTKAQLEGEVDRVNAEDPQAGLAKGRVDDMKSALTAYFTN